MDDRRYRKRRPGRQILETNWLLTVKGYHAGELPKQSGGRVNVAQRGFAANVGQDGILRRIGNPPGSPLAEHRAVENRRAAQRNKDLVIQASVGEMEKLYQSAASAGRRPTPQSISVAF